MFVLRRKLEQLFESQTSAFDTYLPMAIGVEIAPPLVAKTGERAMEEEGEEDASS